METPEEKRARIFREAREYSEKMNKTMAAREDDLHNKTIDHLLETGREKNINDRAIAVFASALSLYEVMHESTGRKWKGMEDNILETAKELGLNEEDIAKIRSV